MSYTTDDLVGAINKHTGGFEPEQWADVASHGADTGWPGFTYTGDLVDFHDTNKRMLWDLLADQAEDFGVSVLQHLASFGAQDRVTYLSDLKSLIAWWGLEHAAHAIENGEVELEEYEDEEGEEVDEPDEEDRAYMCPRCGREFDTLADADVHFHNPLID